MHRILLAGGGTGGHLMPALAIAAALRETHPEIEPVLVGASRGIEARILPARPFRYHLLPTEPIYRRQWWKNLRWPFIAGRLWREMNRVLEAESPVVVVGTGGYASGPMVWLAARRGIPTAIQEQNAFPGIVTRRLARRVREVYLGIPEAGAHLAPGRDTVLVETGNPIVPPVAGQRAFARARLGIPESATVLLVTGGSQGSLAVNRAVAGWLDQGGGKGITILWAAGAVSFAEFSRYDRPPDVRVVEFLDPMSDAMAAADLALSRGGAITIAELCAHGLPSVIVPLPTAAADHQSHNARALERAGASRHLAQSSLDPATLGLELENLLGDPARRHAMAAAARERGRPEAAAVIARRIGELMIEGLRD